MSAIDESSIALTRVEDVRDRRRWLRIVRWVAIAVWATAVIYRTVTTASRSTASCCCSTSHRSGSGQHRPGPADALRRPRLVAVRVGADRLRPEQGSGHLIGRPTMWHWQVDADRWLFFGTVPTVWLQEQLKLSHPPWWEVVHQLGLHVVLHPSLRHRRRAVAAQSRGVEVVRPVVRWPQSFAGLVSTRCCRPRRPGRRPGARRPTSKAALPARVYVQVRAGCARRWRCWAGCSPLRTAPTSWIERIVGRGWGNLNLHSATALIDQGQASVNLVAAIPSLHAGMSPRLRVPVESRTPGVAARCWWPIRW